MEKQSARRGSETMWSKVFEEDMPVGEEMTRALGDARQQLLIRRWWKYGQPRVDHIKALMEIPIRQAGGVLQDIIASGVPFELKGFPLGEPSPDVLHLEVTFQRNLR